MFLCLSHLYLSVLMHIDDALNGYQPKLGEEVASQGVCRGEGGVDGMGRAAGGRGSAAFMVARVLDPTGLI